MKLLQINCVYGYGSTGRIVESIHQTAVKNGFESYVVYGSGKKYEDSRFYCMQDPLSIKFSVLQTRLFGKHGFYNKGATAELIKWIREVDPDIIHLQNIHGHYINVRLLFEYLKESGKPVVWTLHDCWSFTGHCAHYITSDCDRWMTGCHDCESLKEYPKSLVFDRSKESWTEKKALFTSLKELQIISPSKWLSAQISRSFLKDYPLYTIYNGIDLEIFKPHETDLKKKLGIEGCFIILGMANKWLQPVNEPVVRKIVENLGDGDRIIIIGAKELPEYMKEKCVCVSYIHDQGTLSDYYNIADVFVNLTLADTLPTVNTESLACGTPIVTYDNSGTSESISNKTGILVKNLDGDGIIAAINTIKKNTKALYTDKCVERAGLYFDKASTYDLIIQMYKKMLER